MAAKARGRVRFNVGGKVFETTSTTLANAGRQSMLGALLDDHWNVVSDAPAEYFVDRSPCCFAILLDLLGTGQLHIPPNLPTSSFSRRRLTTASSTTSGRRGGGPSRETASASLAPLPAARPATARPSAPPLTAAAASPTAAWSTSTTGCWRSTHR